MFITLQNSSTIKNINKFGGFPWDILCRDNGTSDSVPLGGPRTKDRCDKCSSPRSLQNKTKSSPRKYCPSFGMVWRTLFLSFEDISGADFTRAYEFPNATRFIEPREVDRSIIVSQEVKSLVNWYNCCSSPCFCTTLPSSIGSSADICNKIAEMSNNPERLNIPAQTDVTKLGRGGWDDW